jgi:NADH-quinone oxidoreductase subunit D
MPNPSRPRRNAAFIPMLQRQGLEAQDVGNSPPRATEVPGEERFQEMLLNLGPQHPSTHGVLRLVLQLEGETVVDCTPVIGYLHRGIEKILENRPIMGGIRYMDNSDYLSPMLNEMAYAGAVEQLMGIEPPRRAQYMRLLVGELQRRQPPGRNRRLHQ